MVFLGTKFNFTNSKDFGTLYYLSFRISLFLRADKKKKRSGFQRTLVWILLGFLRIQIFLIKPFLVSWFPQQIALNWWLLVLLSDVRIGGSSVRMFGFFFGFSSDVWTSLVLL
jgi:hypothetical protein